ncbi:MAG: hypothetical protein LUG24_07935 [Clostridiales bacterium]|nr:hypothetical protein [Clostridiales bacterium]
MAGELKNIGTRLGEISSAYYSVSRQVLKAGGCSVNIIKAGESISLNFRAAEEVLLNHEEFLNQSIEAYLETERSVITGACELEGLKGGQETAVSGGVLLNKEAYLPEVEICRLDFSVERGTISVPKIKGKYKV